MNRIVYPFIITALSTSKKRNNLVFLPFNRRNKTDPVETTGSGEGYSKPSLLNYAMIPGISHQFDTVMKPQLFR